MDADIILLAQALSTIQVISANALLTALNAINAHNNLVQLQALDQTIQVNLNNIAAIRNELQPIYDDTVNNLLTNADVAQLGNAVQTQMQRLERLPLKMLSMLLMHIIIWCNCKL